jgi:AcrR family transcriptional regulator
VPKVTEEYRNDRRALITGAAAGCFARKGVHQTSMSDIIAASGLSAGAIYNHFRSKEEIMVSTAVGLIKDRLVRAVETDPDDVMSPADLVSTGLGVLQRATVDDEKPITGLILQFWAEGVVNPKLLELMRQEMTSIRQALLTPIKRWARREYGLSPARADRWAERNSQLFISVITGYIIQREIFPSFDSRSYIADAVKLVQTITPDN